VAIVLLDPPASESWTAVLPGSPDSLSRTGIRLLAQGLALAGRAPATAVYLLVLGATTLALATSSDRTVLHLLLGASTNLRNMTTHPLRVLVASAFWVESTAWFWPMAVLVIAVMGVSEWVLGLRRTLVAFAVGHVGATLLTVGAVGIGVDAGLLPRHLAYALDVGPSYGLAALGGVLVTRLSQPWLRWIGASGLLGGLALALVVDGDFTDAGHLLAASIGLLLGRVLTARRRTPGHPEVAR